jgi:hypothetical protein
MSAFRRCLLRWADARSFGNGEGCAYARVKVPAVCTRTQPGLRSTMSLLSLGHVSKKKSEQTA